MHLTASLSGAPSLAWFQTQAATAERGRLDAVLLGHPFIPGPASGLDPLPLLVALAASTTAIGLAAALQLDHAEPFNIARSFAAADRLTAGRAAWIAGPARPSARYGHTPALDRAQRAARAEECIAVARKLWDSWEDDAVILDKPRGMFSDPDRVHRIDHAGPWFTVRGPLNAPRPLQGHPVMIQWDPTPEGLALARRTADLFIADHADPARLRAMDLGGVHVLATITPVLAPSRMEAEDRADALGRDDASLFAGTPEALADHIEGLGLADHIEGRALAFHGVNIVPAVLPLDLDRFVDSVVPLLEARGLRPRTQGTLRDRLGLVRPVSQFAA